MIGSLYIRSHITRRKTILHSQSIEERLYCRTNLTAPTCHHIIHKMIIIYSSNISLHSTCLRFHRHEARTKERLVITYRVERTHHCVYLSSISEHSHINRLAERSTNLFFRNASSLHATPAVTLLNIAIKN